MTGIGVRRDGKLDPTMEHLASFVPGVLALGTVKGNPKIESDLACADRLVRTFSFLQQKVSSRVLPEKVRFNIANASRGYDFMPLVDEYLLRPEAVESIYVLWKFTGLQKYRDIAWNFFQGIQKACKVRHGYSSVSRVSRRKIKHTDLMESFFLAETLKYLYLTFSDSRFLSPTEWVFNTEDHPLRILTQLPTELREMLQFRDVP
jgi:mannosyl-oligosaccharide alpha-1,2-mannosidase